MILWIFIFILALAALLKSSQLFAQNLKKLASALGWCSFFVGMTVLALSTTLPELATSLWAAPNAFSSLVASTAVGSTIANLLLVLGVAAITYKKIEAKKMDEHLPLGLLLGSTFLLVVTLYDGTVTRVEGLVLLGGALLYTLSNVEAYSMGRFAALKNWLSKEKMRAELIVMGLASGAATVLSSYFVVKAINQIASIGNLRLGVLGASLLAIGTTLPELVVSMNAFRKGDSEMALGNVLGSCVLNATLVVGLPALIHPLTVSNETLTLGVPFLLMSTLLFVFALVQRRISSYEGTLYILLYGIFLFQLLTLF